MTTEKKRRIEFGDFQTPDALAVQVCNHLHALGLRPDVIIEPTCGVGAFVLAAAHAFNDAREVLGYEVNESYPDALRDQREGELRYLGVDASGRAALALTPWRRRGDVGQDSSSTEGVGAR